MERKVGILKFSKGKQEQSGEEVPEKGLGKKPCRTK